MAATSESEAAEADHDIATIAHNGDSSADISSSLYATQVTCQPSRRRHNRRTPKMARRKSAKLHRLNNRIRLARRGRDPSTS
jgi:hypothetical protein